jgi:hypothetical protein
VRLELLDSCALFLDCLFLACLFELILDLLSRILLLEVATHVIRIISIVLLPIPCLVSEDVGGILRSLLDLSVGCWGHPHSSLPRLQTMLAIFTFLLSFLTVRVVCSVAKPFATCLGKWGRIPTMFCHKVFIQWGRVGKD